MAARYREYIAVFSAGRRLVATSRRLTLIEVVVVLTVAVILSATMHPVIMRGIRSARMARAQREMGALRDAIILFMQDVDTDGMVQNASVPPEEQAPVQLAVGDGDIPDLGEDGSVEWIQPVDYGTVDFLEYHLTANTPGNDISHAYEPWKGAYITGPIEPDPWGNRYMVNVLYLASESEYEVVVLSAGPSGEVNSEFTQEAFEPGGDDIIRLVSTGG